LFYRQNREYPDSAGSNLERACARAGSEYEGGHASGHTAQRFQSLLFGRVLFLGLFGASRTQVFLLPAMNASSAIFAVRRVRNSPALKMPRIPSQAASGDAEVDFDEVNERWSAKRIVLR
jgi:hypothetical protein